MTTLRLSSKPAITINEYMQHLTNDTSISLSQKNDCLKTLTVVVKNLVDANKGCLMGEDGLKYRTLKLDNPKLKSRLFPSSSSSKVVMDLLMDSTHVGMKPKRRLKRDVDINMLVMENAPSPAIQEHIRGHILPTITATQADINIKMMAAAATKEHENKSHKKAKLLLAEHSNSVTNTKPTPSVIPPVEKLSEKQIARRELEKKKQLEKEQDKQHRLNTKAQIAADKLVRETDENWKPAVSAAADKTGTGIQTFRDRHGE